MGLVAAVSLILGFIVVYTLVVEIYTILFRLTGLTNEKAYFQVISLLTNSGFTTQESEIITSDKMRRNIAKCAMLTGYVFSVIIISLIINIFQNLSVGDLNATLIGIAISFGVMIFLLILFRIKKVKKLFAVFIEKISRHFMADATKNSISLLDTYGSMVIAEVKVRNVPEMLKDVPMAEAGLKENYDTMVMLVKTGLKTPYLASGDTIIKKNYTIIVFGPLKNIKEIFTEK